MRKHGCRKCDELSKTRSLYFLAAIGIKFLLRTFSSIRIYSSSSSYKCSKINNNTKIRRLTIILKTDTFQAL